MDASKKRQLFLEQNNFWDLVYQTYTLYSHPVKLWVPDLHAGGRFDKTERGILRMSVHEPYRDGDVVLIAFVHNRNRA